MKYLMESKMVLVLWLNNTKIEKLEITLKFMRALPMEWDVNSMAMGESKDLRKRTL